MNFILFVAGIVAIILKATGVEPVADWSWWLVTLPLWAGLALTIVVLILAVLAGGVTAGIAAGAAAVSQSKATNNTTLRRVGK